MALVFVLNRLLLVLCMTRSFMIVYSLVLFHLSLLILDSCHIHAGLYLISIVHIRIEVYKLGNIENNLRIKKWEKSYSYMAIL